MSSIANEEFTLSDQWFFSEKIPANWQRVVPADATPFILKNENCNLDCLRENVGHEKDECVVYNQFHADHDGKLSIGLGCDWWMQVFCNGVEYLNTMKHGNGIGSYSRWNHPLQIPVKKGRNLLAVKLVRGSLTFTFACGLINPPVPEIMPVLVPRGLAFPEPPVSGAGSSYQVILLGDTHFDGPYEVYHNEYAEPDEKLNRIQRGEFARNEAIWKERGPRLLKAAADQMTAKTFGVIQVGDLVQGDCGNPRTHSRMLLDALTAFKGEFGSLPLLTVAGNHDVRGPGAEEAYRQTLLPYLSRELKTEISATTFYFMMEEDLYLFIDFNAPDCEVIRKAFARHSDARYKFVITHGPVIPADSRSCFWFLFGNGADTLRRYFREVFLQNDVIVLTGHEHALELLECMTDSGRITQLMVNSVWSSEKLARYVQNTDQPGDYGQKLRKFYKNSDGVQLLAEYQTAVTRYWKADGAGFFRLDISPESVIAYYFGGDSRIPSKMIRLR